MLKYLLPLIAATIAVAACNISPRQHSTAADSNALSTHPALDPRRHWVTAFSDLGKRVSDNTGESFAALMSFPLSEDVFAVLVEDTVFNAEYAAADRRLSRTMFLKDFPKIAESLQWPEFRELFRQIHPGELLRLDTAHATIHQADEPCLRYYHIQLSHDTATISYGSDHNDAYKKAGNEDGDVCEYATIWEFRLEGQQLRLLRMYQAG